MAVTERRGAEPVLPAVGFDQGLLALARLVHLTLEGVGGVGLEVVLEPHLQQCRLVGVQQRAQVGYAPVLDTGGVDVLGRRPGSRPGTGAGGRRARPAEETAPRQEETDGEQRDGGLSYGRSDGTVR